MVQNLPLLRVIEIMTAEYGFKATYDTVIFPLLVLSHFEQKYRTS